MDVVSEGELRRALAAGTPREKIIFSGVGKTRAEMALGLEAGIRCFNVESEPELEALSEVAASRGTRARIAIRVNPDVDAKTHAKISTGKSENKFGVPISRAREVYARAAQLPGVEVDGVDMHIGSQIIDLQPFDDAFALLAEFVGTLRADGHASTMSISAAASACPIASTTSRRRIPKPTPPSSRAARRRSTARFSWSPAASSSATPACW